MKIQEEIFVLMMGAVVYFILLIFIPLAIFNVIEYAYPYFKDGVVGKYTPGIEFIAWCWNCVGNFGHDWFIVRNTIKRIANYPLCITALIVFFTVWGSVVLCILIGFKILKWLRMSNSPPGSQAAT